jgi:hypothetical protein
MAKKSSNTGGKYWYKISIETVRVWTFLGVLLVVGFLGVQGFGSVRRHFLSKQIEVAMEESRSLMERLRSEDDLFHFNAEWSRARTNLEQARAHIVEGEIDSALEKAERSRSLLLSIHEALLKKTGGEAQFIGVQGGVEYRRGERGEWTTARNLTDLYEGDYIKTTGNGSAEVMTADGALFTVRPDTVILVSSSRSPNGPKREQTIALESGWVNLSTSQSAGRIKTPDAEAQVSERSSAVVTYDETSRTSRYSVYRGKLGVTSSSGQTRQLEELEEVTQRGEALAAVRKLPEAPALLAPRDNLELAFGSVPEVELTWEPVKGASRYALQVSTNRLFVDNVIDVENRRRPRARVGVRAEGAFVWRVAAFDSSGAKGPWSLYNRFRVTSRQAPGATGAP